MTAPTVPVTVRLSEQSGPVYASIVVRARLDINEVYDGFIISDISEAVTDATGTAVLQCFPNAPAPAGLGTMGSTYRFTANIVGGTRLNVMARVPNVPCDLHEILVDTQGVTLDAAEIAVSQAQAAAAAASNDADQTAADRVQTGLDRVATGEDRAVVTEDRVIAEDAALVATESADIASDSALAASDSLQSTQRIAGQAHQTADRITSQLSQARTIANLIFTGI